jgi:adenosylcobinamide kinase/adenosylcobinamide-phosphate guanylyltransferase
MRARIARHCAERPADWDVVETPRQLEATTLAVPPGNCLVIDCLTLWIANLLHDRDDGAIQADAERAARAAADRPGLTLVISNEVGLGIVPENALARRYRDILGRVNATFAAAAERAYLLVAGRLLALEPVDRLLGEVGR